VSELTVLAALTNAVLEAASALGLDAAALRAEASLEPELLADPDARVPLARHLALWTAISRQPVGGALGARLALGGLGVVGYALPHDETVGAALAFLDRQRALIHPDAVPRMELRAESFAYVQTVPLPFARLIEPVDAQAAGITALLRVLAGPDVDPLAVALQRPEGDLSQQRFHRCKVRWNAPAIEVEFARHVLARPLARADSRLFGYLARRAEELRAALPSEASYLARTRREIGVMLAQGEPTLALVAKRLAVSERTLHRRLAEEEARFGDLLDEARRERALLLLGDPTLSAAEVSGLLGYGEPSTFFRAFKRWTGETPRAYRARA
jgi:AraC-like DNA-binding protein